MDTLTHALSGALIARASAPSNRQDDQLPVRGRIVAGFLAGAFPDSDFVIRFFTDPITFLNLHRGVTHSIVLLPLWALLLAGVFSLLWRRQYPWQAFYTVALLGIGIHICGDVITTFGTQILAPFSDYKAIIPTTFIIDLYFTGIILAGLLASWWWRVSRVPAIAGLVVLSSYVGFQSMQMGRAYALGESYVQLQGLQGATVTALPQPLSPFNWKIIVREDERYRIAHVNLLRTESLPAADDAGFLARASALYRPAQQLLWEEYPQYGEATAVATLAREAWGQPVLAGYRRFAEYPALYAVEENGIGTCVWFNDLRFAMGNLRHPFLYGACRQYSDSRWGLYRLEGDRVTKI